MCTASGDPHYVTFNGQKIHFQGVCTYRLVEVRNGTYGMRVYVKNQQVEGKDVSTTKQVTVYMEPSLDKIVLGQRNTVLVSEPRQEKTCLQGLPPGKTQTGLLSYRD